MSNSPHSVHISGSELSFSCQPGDTILRAALREGLAFPYECNVGSCGNCKFELLEGAVHSAWAEAPGLSEKDKLKNKWLGCQTHAVGDLQIKLRTADKYKPVHTPLKTDAWLRGTRTITHDMSEFRFELAEPICVWAIRTATDVGYSGTACLLHEHTRRQRKYHRLPGAPHT
jgi:toluene monooxygenase electron transfer component